MDGKTVISPLNENIVYSEITGSRENIFKLSVNEWIFNSRRKMVTNRHNNRKIKNTKYGSRE